MIREASVAESKHTRDRKARERTARWREKRAAARMPEACQIDRAILAAFAYSLETGSLTLDEHSLGTMAELAVGLLSRHHDPIQSRRALALRLRKLSKSREIPNMLRSQTGEESVTA